MDLLAVRLLFTGNTSYTWMPRQRNVYWRSVGYKLVLLIRFSVHKCVGSKFCKKVNNTAGPTNIVNAPTIDRGVL